jgi:hypothetical protein
MRGRFSRAASRELARRPHQSARPARRRADGPIRGFAMPAQKLLRRLPSRLSVSRTLHQSNGRNADTCGLAFRHSRSGTPHFIHLFSPSLDPCATQRRFWDLDQSHSKVERNRGSKWHCRPARKYYHERPYHRGYYDGQRDIAWPNVANSYHRSPRLIFPKTNLRLARARQSQQEPRHKSFSSFPPGWSAP